MGPVIENNSRLINVGITIFRVKFIEHVYYSTSSISGLTNIPTLPQCLGHYYSSIIKYSCTVRNGACDVSPATRNYQYLY